MGTLVVTKAKIIDFFFLQDLKLKGYSFETKFLTEHAHSTVTDKLHIRYRITCLLTLKKKHLSQYI